MNVIFSLGFPSLKSSIMAFSSFRVFCGSLPRCRRSPAEPGAGYPKWPNVHMLLVGVPKIINIWNAQIVVFQSAIHLNFGFQTDFSRSKSMSKIKPNTFHLSQPPPQQSASTNRQMTTRSYQVTIVWQSKVAIEFFIGNFHFFKGISNFSR